MKSRLLLVSVFSIVIAFPAFGQVEEGNITSFTDGTTAVAAEVNANFQALLDGINSLADRVASLESSSGGSGEIGGSYIISGVGITTDACGDGSAIALTFSGISGTATASNGVLTLNLTEERIDPILRDDGTGNFEVENRTDILVEPTDLSYGSNGVISGIDAGAFSADGSVFTLSNANLGCESDATFITGVRN